MSENQSPKLHLPDLSIRNFRGIQDLSIKKLGRVTLLAGRNGVGKTTVLEAVRVYAARGRYDIFEELLHKRHEYVILHTEEQDFILDYSTLFFDRYASPGQTISIGPNTNEDQLRIEITTTSELSPTQLDLFPEAMPSDSSPQALRVTYHDSKAIIPCFLGSSNFFKPQSFLNMPRALRRKILGDSNLPESVECGSLGPELPSSSALARFWDKTVIISAESLGLRAINLTEKKINRIVAVGDTNGRLRREGRRIMVKAGNFPSYVPLNSLGDGTIRSFATVLALAHNRDGFLVIDEVENGIHHSALRGFWSIVLEAAQKFNVQVFATTHSFDCVRAFAKAAIENEKAEGTLVRLDNKDGQIRTVEYSEKHLEIAADQDIEVR